MIDYILVIPILASFVVTLFLIPQWIKRVKNAGIVGKDIQKAGQPEVSEAGGVTVIAGFSLGVLAYIAINTFLYGSVNNFIEIFALLSTLLLVSFVAFTDDILGWKIGLRRRTRLILVAFASIPLVAINAGKHAITLPFFGITDLGLAYPVLLIPLGIVGATTTYNFLAGMNGLEAGQGVIMVSAFSLVAYLTGNVWISVVGLCMVSSLLAFLIFNFYPATVLPGDSLTYVVGGLIAIMSILGNFERVAVFFFIPYIVETLLKIRGKLVKQSFGKLNSEGYLDMKYEKIYSLTHLSIFLLNRTKYKATERRVVLSIWITQLIIVSLGLLIFSIGGF